MKFLITQITDQKGKCNIILLGSVGYLVSVEEVEVPCFFILRRPWSCPRFPLVSLPSSWGRGLLAKVPDRFAVLADMGILLLMLGAGTSLSSLVWRALLVEEVESQGCESRSSL